MECSGCKMMFVAEALASVSGGIYCSVCRDSTGGGDQVQSPRSVCTIDAFFEHERKMKEEEEIQQMENELEDLNRTLKKEQLRKALKEAHEKKEKLCEKETEVPKPVPEKKVGSQERRDLSFLPAYVPPWDRWTPDMSAYTPPMMAQPQYRENLVNFRKL